MTSANSHSPNNQYGFTLVELAIVLVIIGLLVGGVLVGQDLIRAAETRAQVTQITQFSTAARTFQTKYKGIPGDLHITRANRFGFDVGANCTGQEGGRNGTGLIYGYSLNSLLQGGGETAFFWSDLSKAQLIPGVFPDPSAASICCTAAGYTALAGTAVGHYLPPARFEGNYVTVYANVRNWFTVSGVTSTNINGGMTVTPVIPVTQAYNADKKSDDGIPTTGITQATYVAAGGVLANAPNTAVAGGTAVSCYDTTTGNYSTAINDGSGRNCALSFRMQ